MDGRVPGIRYDEVQVSGEGRLHAGSNYNTYTVTNYNNYYFNYDPRDPNSQQPAQLPENGQQPRRPSYVRPMSEPTNVSSPSQSSDSTNAEDGYGRAITAAPTESNSTGQSYQILQEPTREDSRYRYFLDGSGLAQHVVRRHVPYLAGRNAEVHRWTYQRREGYLVIGMLLDEEQIAALRRQSREYDRDGRAVRHLTSRD